MPGKGRHAFSFDGANDYVGFGTNMAHLTGALTVSAWVKLVLPPTDGRVIAGTYKNGTYPNSRGWILGTEAGTLDRLYFKVQSPAGALAEAMYTGFFAEFTNKWVHVAGVFKPGVSVTLYTNGVPAASNLTSITSVTAIGTTNANLRIGKRADGNQGLWSGLIDEVRIYEGALPLFMIQALANEAPVSLPGILSEQLEKEVPAGSRTATLLLVR